MNNDERRFFFRQRSSTLIVFFLVVLAAYIQAFHIFSWGGINPNLAPVALLTLSFFERNIYVLLAAMLVTVFFLALSFFWIETGLVLLAFAVVSAANIFWLRRGPVMALLSVAAATLLASALLWRLLWWQNLRSFCVELVLNCIWGMLMFFFFTILKARER
jgi:hypothetical protein